MVRLGAPDQDAREGFRSAVGLDRTGDHTNILPLDLNFTFNFILCTLLVLSLIST
jgi:hypothetical protein